MEDKISMTDEDDVTTNDELFLTDNHELFIHVQPTAPGDGLGLSDLEMLRGLLYSSKQNLWENLTGEGPLDISLQRISRTRILRYTRL